MGQAPHLPLLPARVLLVPEAAGRAPGRHRRWHFAEAAAGRRHAGAPGKAAAKQLQPHVMSVVEL